MECPGAVGYVGEGPMPLLYREAPLNSIWEGSGNVICTDIERSLAREPGRFARFDAAHLRFATQDANGPSDESPGALPWRLDWRVLIARAIPC